ncbi:(deoxy)nucleoside triphosphate pyrophosphohydrolase [Trichlorobacter lovleyi]|uniref:(deoxy)nucleoside triphosphate pyrophosphohydrolase n=1 Tax=Trichlorobacter lovleyi TaxID=313985 RepID=UPI0023F28ABF|nr:(deoxy)nucleoside triphosphate pyrophosphohydrolase [Trichlorobacter lovleyi]
MSDKLSHIHVACAIIKKDGLILATQRSATMSLPLKWEFPGGKLETGESAEQCLQRELQEELGIVVRVGAGLEPLTHCYPTFTVTLHPFLCDTLQGQMILHEHSAACWLAPHELATLDWAEADWPIISLLAQQP